MFKEKRIEITINSLLLKHNLSLRELSRMADIDISALSTLARGKRKRVDLGHLQRIAEALDITDMNELIKIKNIEE